MDILMGIDKKVRPVSSKTWFEMWEEEELEKGRLSETNGNSSFERYTTKLDKSGIGFKEDIISDENARESVTIESKVVRIPKSEELPNFSVSHLKTSSANEMTMTIGVEKADSKRVNTHEDLSISSHLNIFKMDSQSNDDLGSPKKSSISYYLRKNTGKVQTSSDWRIQQSEGLENEGEDNILKLRNRNIIRKSSPDKASNAEENHKPSSDDITLDERKPSKRPREPEVREKNLNKKTYRGIETDPVILQRRMKQIEYGKNTIGYDRYIQLVPRESREKEHPKTPPMHFKFSRRAWDGLVKIWRVRLHYWDPPSMGGGNNRSLELGNDISDLSSTEGSVAGTPGPSRKRQRKNPSILTTSEEDQDLGCTVLPPE